MQCYQCGHEIIIKDEISRNDVCDNCGMYVRCCMNCKLYDRFAYHQCLEPEAEWVNNKEKSNYCEYFSPSEKDIKMTISKSEAARQKLENMFKNLNNSEASS